MQLEHREQGGPRLAFLLRQFHRGMERQHQKDAEVIASLVRALSARRGPAQDDVARFAELVRVLIN